MHALQHLGSFKKQLVKFPRGVKTLKADGNHRSGPGRQRVRAELVPRTSGFTFRAGTWDDTPLIFKSVLAEKMNPLVGFAPSRFTIAEKDGEQVGFGQMRPLQSGLVELASLVVLPAYRGQGVGSALIDALLDATPPGDEIYLVTIGGRVTLYERHGFREVKDPSDIPGSLIFEYYAGGVVAKLAVNDRIVVMRRI